MSVRRKLGILLEYEVVQKLKLEKDVFYKKLSTKFIFLNLAFWDPPSLKFHNRNDIIKGARSKHFCLNNKVLRGLPVRVNTIMMFSNRSKLE